MISVLVCSVKPSLYQQLARNIEQTIGVGYELLYYDNRESKKGLSEVYNLLARQARFEVLCFVHEDVIFTTNNWGEILLRLFSQRDIGVVGVAGSKYKSAAFSGWYTGQKEYDCANIVHRFVDHEEKIYLNPDFGTSQQEVVCADGVFICARKEVWEIIKFDEVGLKGFHFYDMDFTLRAAKVCKVVVSYEIDMIHITNGGDFGDKWAEVLFVYHERYKHLLPFTISANIPPKVELRITKVNLDFLKTHAISFKNKIKWIMLQELYRYPGLYYGIVKFFVYRPLHLKVIHNLIRSK